MSNEKKAIPDRKVVYDEITDEAYERKSKPMNFQQLRERLKHIAGFCWGLSIDLANEIERRDNLLAECDRLKNENTALLNEIRELKAPKHKHHRRTAAELAALTPEQREEDLKRKREYQRKYHEEHRGTPIRKRKRDEDLTPEELKKRNQRRKWNARYNAKKANAQ